MSHTIHLGSPKYDKAIVVCNGDFSGKLSFRAWKSIDGWEDREPDVSVDLPDGLGVPFVRAYLERRLSSAFETILPRLLDKFFSI
jgi:hypothetical protein